MARWCLCLVPLRVPSLQVGETPASHTRKKEWLSAIIQRVENDREEWRNAPMLQ